MYVIDTVDDVAVRPMWAGSSSVFDVASACRALVHLHMRIQPRRVHESMEAVPMSSTNSFRPVLFLLVLVDALASKIFHLAEVQLSRPIQESADQTLRWICDSLTIHQTRFDSGDGRVHRWRSCVSIGCQRHQMIGAWSVVSMRWYMRMWWRWNGDKLWRRGLDCVWV